MLAEIIWNEATLGTVMALSIPIIAIIASFWFKIESVKSESELKKSMVERGMSVDEIERVLAMRSHKK